MNTDMPASAAPAVAAPSRPFPLEFLETVLAVGKGEETVSKRLRASTILPPSTLAPLLFPPFPVDRLTRLPPEILETIFDYAYASGRWKGCFKPISKALLPFQRRQVTSLRLHFLHAAWPIPTFLPILSKLQHLSIDPQPHLAAVLSSLPNPQVLRSLSLYCIPSGMELQASTRFADSIASALATLTSLERLHVDTSFVPLTHPAVLAILRTLPIKRLELDPRTLLTADDLLPLLTSSTPSGPRALTKLELVVLNTADGEEGERAEQFFDKPGRGKVFGEDWTLPVWPLHCPAEDMQRLVSAVEEEEGVEVEGPAVWALELMDIWGAEQDTYEDMREELEFQYGSHYYEGAWGAGEEESEEEDRSEEEEEEEWY
ncbi:hypothetical protein JCM10213_000326 [Rhodosporidiobolus nylandii]